MRNPHIRRERRTSEGSAEMVTRLTKPILNAISAALESAVAGDGFDGGDFDGMDKRHFERARDWVHEECERRRKSERSKPAA